MTVRWGMGNVMAVLVQGEVAALWQGFQFRRRGAGVVVGELRGGDGGGRGCAGPFDLSVGPRAIGRSASERGGAAIRQDAVVAAGVGVGDGAAGGKSDGCEAGGDAGGGSVGSAGSGGG